MTSRDFSFWLQGYFEILSAENTTGVSLSIKQVELIKKHLNLVFKHDIDPSMGNAEHQQALNLIHNKPPILPHFEENPLLRC